MLTKSILTFVAVLAISIQLSPFGYVSAVGGTSDCNGESTQPKSCGSCGSSNYTQAVSCPNGATQDTSYYDDNVNSTPCGSGNVGSQACSSIHDATQQAVGCVAQRCGKGG